LQSTLSRAAFAAFRINCGGLYPKKPCPMLTMGCLGDAAAASLTIVLDLHVSLYLNKFIEAVIWDWENAMDEL
jgi:hypothetical protein